MRGCIRSSACTLVLHASGGRGVKNACTSSPCNSPSVSPSTYSMYCWLPEYVNYGLSSSSFRYEYGIVFELLALKRFEDGAEYDQDITKRGASSAAKHEGTLSCQSGMSEKKSEGADEKGDFQSFFPSELNHKRNKIRDIHQESH